MASKASKPKTTKAKPRAKKQAANGGGHPKLAPRRGDNVVITLEDQKPFLDRIEKIKREGIEVMEGVRADINAVKEEMATALNIPKTAVNDIWADVWARIRREERQRKREETNPDTALAYARCAKSLGLDTPFGEWAAEQARAASEPTPEQRARDAEFEEAAPPPPPQDAA